MAPPLESMPRSVVLAILLLVVVGCTSPRAHGPAADDRYPSDYVIPRAFYVGTRVGSTRLRGDFDGRTQVVGPDTIDVPDAGTGAATAFAVGYTKHGRSIEVVYTRANYDELETSSVALNALYALRANERVQPYALVGLVFPWATLDDASTDGMAIGDADLRSGIGLQLAGGVAWMFGQRVALDLRGGYLWQEFSEAEGVAGSSGSIDDAVNGSQFELSVGLTFFRLLRGGR